MYDFFEIQFLKAFVNRFPCFCKGRLNICKDAVKLPKGYFTISKKYQSF